jgi:hypothetical protein
MWLATNLLDINKGEINAADSPKQQLHRRNNGQPPVPNPKTTLPCKRIGLEVHV